MPRLRIIVRGAVQGVGFRPFVFRLAKELGLTGWVNNSPQGVLVEAEGPPASLEKFLLRLANEKPARSFIHSLESSWLDAVGYTKFEIRPSETGGGKTALVLPDIATCPDCRREIFEPANRRYRYPFTNCTNCGPRFSIIEALPYDRANTSMKQFSMCPQCQAEYDDPRNRRFHAQPNACPVCGPRLELWDEQGRAQPGTDGSRAILEAAADAVRSGRIVAVKGLGGFHLIVAADNENAVRRLRERKHREEKPFALMFPSLEKIRTVCEVSPLEERLLASPEAPIVLLRRRGAPNSGPHVSPIAPGIAPQNPYLGVMLPYTPLHHLLLSLLGFPVVATSGNLSDEPICTDEREASARLSGIADLFLVHNRPIVRHVDDSIVRVMAGRGIVLRRARGFAPLPLQVRSAECGVRSAECGVQNVLAVGAHLKNAIALSVGPQVFLSQHIGDLETDAAYEAFRKVIADFERLYESRADLVAADAHPDYLSTQYARELAGQRPSAGSAVGQGASPAGSASGDADEASALPAAAGQGSSPGGSASVLAGDPSACADSHLEAESSEPRPLIERFGPYVSVQHHLAHILSCMAENELEPPVLGVAWDGTGYGLDGTVWGGEFFEVSSNSCRRVAHLRTFRLPGGDQAVKEPRRSALGILYEMYGDAAFTRNDLAPIGAFSTAEATSLKTMLGRGINSPFTSSAGRLFDAAASLAGLRQQTRFEGQAAMELEFAMGGVETDTAYALATKPADAAQLAPDVSGRAKAPLVLDWFPLIESLVADVHAGAPVGLISARFHNALVEAIVTVARHAGQLQVCLSGGCFQNRYLTERAIQRLRAEGFRPYWHQRVPPNDGGICLGQIVAASRSE